MRVAHLSLTDFRNYPTAELALCEGPNLIIGRNGQGKTNLVEAIGYFSTLRSHRVSGDAALIRAGADQASARMRVEASGRSVLLEIQINRDRQNRASVNRNPVRPRELMRWFASVAFVPEDLGIVRGDPAGRRRFLDDSLIVRHPIAAGTLSDYERVVRQRTALLKSARKSGVRSLGAALEVWDDQLVTHGSQIMLARRELVRDLTPALRTDYEALVGQDHRPDLGISESVYSETDVSRETDGVSELAEVSRETLMEHFRRALEEVRSREIDRGVTLIGPHRDDLLLGLNALPVKGYASHGESWSFALSLKMALANILREESPAGDPVIVLDDVFAELDRGRRERLMSAVSGFEQVIVTAAVEEDVPDSVEWNRTLIEAGRIMDESDSLGTDDTFDTDDIVEGAGEE
ncbi:DNA replication/repair protein RecF [Leucobacter ruminantium]|uniref:DNA replication and repair protein RecF n=1 Tax=Leucobacter ruminantium TaxID=1289170 RepID=A0A939RUM2_9MICO|nr:DNA replication/repair protein RecF [Leucobacter ruminantium]MBO1805925.1 DNA replication/repair protein RecF [Leucobacter ruminantium]